MRFSGSTLHLLKYNGAFILSFGFAASLGLMGDNWEYLFLASLAAMLPLFLLTMAALTWLNRFVFDDEGGTFRKPGGRRIPYSRVRGVYLVERGGAVDVFVKQGFLRTATLAEGVPAAKADRLRDELSRRFPDRMHRRSRWTVLVAPAAVFAMIVLLLASAHLFLYQRYPQLRTPLGTIAPEARKGGRALPPLEFVEWVGFTPPAGFRYIGEEGGELYFEDKARRRRLKVVGGIQRTLLREQKALFRHAMGVGNQADLLDLTYRARFGIIPLLLRTQDLAGLEQVAVYGIAPPLRGYLRQGRRDKTEETHIVLTDEQGDQEIHFFFFGPKRLSEKTLRTFLSGIRPIRPTGPEVRTGRGRNARSRA